VPMEFWRWLLHRARLRKPQVFFMAEAYDNDPAKLTDGHVLDELLDAGFDAVYDDPIYDLLMGLYDVGKWCNDLDAHTFTGPRFHRSLRYGENHDEVRLANPHEWGGIGMSVGKPVCAALFAMGRGPLMVYHGQELGEEASIAAGFGGGNARTTIFDYWSLPAMDGWINGGAYDGAGLNEAQRELRDWYGRLVRLMAGEAWEQGDFYGLNFFNRDHASFGRIDDESVSGHWLYAFLRTHQASGKVFLVVVNFHPQKAMEQVRIRIPHDAMESWPEGEQLQLHERLDGLWQGTAQRRDLTDYGISLPVLAPLSAQFVEIIIS
jgi:hypothetical protein